VAAPALLHSPFRLRHVAAHFVDSLPNPGAGDGPQIAVYGAKTLGLAITCATALRDRVSGIELAYRGS
jgi:hypothetical protein